MYPTSILTKKGHPIVAKTGDDHYESDDSNDGMT
jgi:hypothetical protein